MVDVNLLKSFLEQVIFVKKVHEIQYRYGFTQLNMTQDELFNASLDELRMARPNEIEMELMDDSQVLSEADSKIG